MSSTTSLIENLTFTESWNDPYNKLNVGVQAGLGVFIVLILVIGSVILLGIIHFERYGADPQKRGLSGQIYSQCCAIVLTNYTVTLPVVFWRITGGPVSGDVYWTWCFIINSYFFIIFFSAFDLLLIKFLTIVWMKQMLPIVDDVIARFLLITNIVAGSVFSLISCNTAGNYFSKMRFIGLPTDLAAHTPLEFDLKRNVLIGFIVSMIFVMTSIKLEKGKIRPEPEVLSMITTSDVGNNVQLNIKTYNKEIVTIVVEIAIWFLASAAAITSMFTMYAKTEYAQIFFSHGRPLPPLLCPGPSSSIGSIEQSGDEKIHQRPNCLNLCTLFVT